MGPSQPDTLSTTSSTVISTPPPTPPPPSQPEEHHVDIAIAEHEFAVLSRHLSALSTRSKPHSSNLEKPVSEELFDLESHLRGSVTAEREAGIRPKHIGVLFDDLSVSGLGGVRHYIPTFPDAVTGFLNVFGTAKGLLRVGKKGTEVQILRGFSGVVKPGEMVLVLGRPGSGCTTFLKVMANMRDGYTGVGGDVKYGRFEAKEFAERYRGESVYNQEDDTHHHPTLTVGQTLGFALDVKTPGKLPSGMSQAVFKDTVITTLLKMFNISHTKNTVIGNQFVRGISGGERKRVSIAEMLLTKASVTCWDQSLRGLDSSTALDYAKSLRIMTNVYKMTTFASFYQASESIYELFDKVLVIDAGREIFFGNISEARAYFEGLGYSPRPRQTTPDYLTGITDEFEREFADGRDESNVPSTPEQLESAFRASKHWGTLSREMEAYRAQVEAEEHVHMDFQTAAMEEKRWGARKGSVYTVPFYMQVWALMKRQFLLKWQDQFQLKTSWATSILVAIVLGTVYLKLPMTSAGAFTRGGVLFISLLFNAFQAFSELASCMLGRPIVNKHKAYTFHRPSALWIAQIAIDILFAAIQILVFSIIVYFMAGLSLSAGSFFTFVFIIVLGYLSMTLFFRTVGCLCPDFDYALKFASVVITLYVLTAGYLIPYDSQGKWVRWVFYISGLGLGFSSLMMNEFKSLVMRCGPESTVPSGPGYNDLAYQTCTLLGSSPGSDIINGRDYIRLTYQYDPAKLWRNIGILIALCAGFLAANALLGEYFQYGAGGKTVTFYERENAERKRLNDALKAKRDDRRLRKTVSVEGSKLRIESRAVLTWEDLVYDVPSPNGGELRLLKHIYGYVKPGELTALMGASGAGKTTLLDVLANRKNIGVISGDVLVDGKAKGAAFQRGTSYAEQLDVHEPTQTVREALRFSAYLRQPFEVSKEEKDAYVEEVIGLLEMEDIADAMIGDPTTGLAVEERKRVTIGVELAAKPELLLFLDEPTSGLDSQSAFNIVRFLKKLSNAGQAILCTIHQPNASLFELFDRLLLLQRGGECVYFGDIGQDSETLLGYFAKHGAVAPPNVNPADFMLNTIGAGLTPRFGDRDWADIWRTSEELANVKAHIQEIKAERIAEVGQLPADNQKEYSTPQGYQIVQVMKRTNLALWRAPNYGFTRLFNHVAVSLFTGVVFLNLDNSRESMQGRVFLIFQCTVLPALILAQVEPKFAFSRLIFHREQSSKMYTQFAFSLSQVLAEIPYSILCATAFYVCIYFPPGMSLSPPRAGYQFLMILICEIFSVTLGQMIAAFTPNPLIASLLNPPLIIVFSIFCGITIPKPNIPKFWRVWLYELNPFTRLVSGMVVTELHGLPVRCTEREFNIFPIPNGTTCGEYVATWFKGGAPGYLRDPMATGECGYCAFGVGDEFYGPLGWSWGDRWRECGIFVIFVVSNLGLLFLASRWLNFARR